VPLWPDQRDRVTLVAYNDEGQTSVGLVMTAELRSGGARVQMLRLWPSSGPASYDSVRQAAQRGGPVIVVAAPRPSAWRPDAVAIPDSLASLIRQLAGAGFPVVMVSMGSPYVLGQAPGVPVFLVAWADNDVTERAVAAALLGRAAISGRLPISLPPAHGVGAGQARAGPPALTTTP
jgi:beta-N-acetylhexosaminidase